MLLPSPGKKSILSSGLVTEILLEKASCVDCGLVSHAKPLDISFIKNIYGNAYSLSVASPESDKIRAEAYANYLTEILPSPNRVLEVGCGSGNLLQSLANLWPQSVFLGIDPALPSDVIPTDKIKYTRGFYDDLKDNLKKNTFDLIFSVNVLEHLLSPQNFFSFAAELLSPTGKITIICPSATPPNLELLFLDHFYTFSDYALTLIANKLGLFRISESQKMHQLGDFQVVTFSRAHENESVKIQRDQNTKDALSLASDRANYLSAWQNLEEILLKRIKGNKKIAMFGAGQMAALLRAYTPETWRKVELLVLDNMSDAWHLEKPVQSYPENKNNLKDFLIIVATSPNTQTKVKMRLISDGNTAVCFNDLISN